MQKTLIVGYGNPDREDDGVAYHLLNRIANELIIQSITFSSEGLDDFDHLPPSSGNTQIHLLFTLQLTPDLAEFFSSFERICFLDAHTGAVPEDVHLEILSPGYQKSPFTHHMTPQTCLGLMDAIYKKQSDAILISIRGYEFGFNRSLSLQTANLMESALQQIMDWIFSSHS